MGGHGQGKHAIIGEGPPTERRACATVDEQNDPHCLSPLSKSQPCSDHAASRPAQLRLVSCAAIYRPSDQADGCGLRSPCVALRRSVGRGFLGTMVRSMPHDGTRVRAGGQDIGASDSAGQGQHGGGTRSCDQVPHRQHSNPDGIPRRPRTGTPTRCLGSAGHCALGTGKCVRPMSSTRRPLQEQRNICDEAATII